MTHDDGCIGFRVTSRRDHANGNTTVHLRCDCGGWIHATRIPTGEADQWVVRLLAADHGED